MSDRDVDTFWRRQSSTEGQPPRVLVRVLVGPGALADAIDAYESLQDVEVDAVFPYPETGLRLASVGAFLLLEGDQEQLAPFRRTTGTLLVDDVEPYHARLVAAGAEIVAAPHDVPTGRGFTAQHPDGTVVEYVHHRPTPEELVAAGSHA